ncbi:MAG: hypothetical protein V4612_04085 [Pseudomonadota bacterium]
MNKYFLAQLKLYKTRNLKAAIGIWQFPTALPARFGGGVLNYIKCNTSWNY